MKYLLDSLQSYESGHSNALCPTRLDVDQSFMGDHQKLYAATRGDIENMSTSIISAVEVNLEKAICTHIDRTHIDHMHVNAPNMYLTVGEVATSTGHDITTMGKSNIATPSQVQLQPCEQPRSSKPCPIPGVMIPHLPRGPDSWLVAVQQWEVGDQEQGLIALKDWPEAWYQGDMRTVTGTKRRMRQLIALFFFMFGMNQQS